MASAASTNAQRVKKAELARMLAVSRQSIGELVKRGVIIEGADGLIDVELARVAIASRVHPSSKTSQALGAPPPPAPAPPPGAGEASTEAVMSYHVAKTLREASEAKIADLKLREMRGELVRVDEVRNSFARKASALRESLLQIPSRLAAVLAAETDHARCHDLLSAELRTVLEQLTAEAM